MKNRNMIDTLTTLLLTLGFFALCPTPKAVGVVPAPDGGYPAFNTAEGTNALKNLTTGVANTAVGWFSLFSNTDGSFNTGVGAGTLLSNVGDPAAFQGINNTAVGAAALLLNNTGQENTANGAATLVNNSTGSFNSAFGAFALNFNVGGSNNTAIGDRALFVNTAGGFNTAIGQTAMLNNTTGSSNIAIGVQALGNNQTGSSNIAIGNVSGTGVTTATNVICIGQVNGADVDSRTYIANIYSNVQPIAGTDPDSVTITSSGRLGRGNVSSRRYKHDIKPIEQASEVLYALKPVSFRYNKEYDATQTLAFGLIAEEVAGVDPDLVGRNPKGEPESVRYDQVNAMLLNEFLKEHRKVEDQQKEIASLRAELKEQRNLIQKVSDRVEMSKPAPQMVAENP
jgi:hypothetical protein